LAKIEGDDEAALGPIPNFDGAVRRPSQKLERIQWVEAERGDVLGVPIEGRVGVVTVGKGSDYAIVRRNGGMDEDRGSHRFEKISPVIAP